MEERKIDAFMMTNHSMFSEKQGLEIRESLSRVDDSRWSIFASIQFKNPLIALILSLLLGSLGADRFYVGDVVLGLLKLFTCGLCGLWTIVDWFLIMRRTRAKNYARFCSLV